ncbi:hypothetical protein C7B61_01655 [filamentous cyanobacterium CCP1]|nr:hypothetical protein C7B76_05495 [filamentous cyanobacterium CCP2]PSB68287.1 hypothetical protein C7B61_01655 [filamentous cyanobacterium CCP1]
MVTNNPSKQVSSQTAGSQLPKEKWLYQWLPLLSIVILATLLRFYQLGEESLWVDEFHSLRAAEELKLHFRVLYFAFLRVWMLFGTSDAWLRSLSVLFGIACIFVTYQLGYRLVGRSTGLLSAFVIAVSPLFIRHSQEVRFYMLSTFLTMVGTLALVYALEKLTIASVGGWIIARLLAIYATPINILLLLPDVILALFRFRHQRRVMIGVIASISALFLLFIPVFLNPEFLNAILQFMSKADVGGRRLGIPELIGQLPAATVFWPMQQLPKQQFWLYGFHGLTMLGLLGFLVFNKRRSSRLNWLAAWAFLPLVVLLFVSTTYGYLWSPRYILLATPYVIILLSAAFIQVWAWNRFVASAIALIYAVSLGGGLLHYYGEKNITDWRGAVQIINANEQTGDVITVPTGFINTYVLGRYYSGSNSIYVAEALSPYRRVEPETIQQGLAQLPIESRLWLLYVQPKGKNARDSEQAFQSVIDEQFTVQTHEVFSGYLDTIDLFLLIPNSVSKETAVDKLAFDPKLIKN